MLLLENRLLECSWNVSLGQDIDKCQLVVQRIKNSPFPEIREFFDHSKIICLKYINNQQNALYCSIMYFL